MLMGPWSLCSESVASQLPQVQILCRHLTNHVLVQILKYCILFFFFISYFIYSGKTTILSLPLDLGEAAFSPFIFF